MSDNKTTLDTEIGKIEIDSEGNLVLTDVKFPPDIIDVRPEPLPQRNANYMTMRQHFTLEVYKSILAGRPERFTVDSYTNEKTYGFAIKAADGLLAQLEKDEK